MEQFILRLLIISSVLHSNFVCSLTSEELFDVNKHRLFQIKLVDKESESKSSIGSGFVVRDGHTVATNYHVVSSAISQPKKFRIIYVRDDESEGELTLYDFDIVNDLAILKSEEDLGEALRVQTEPPKKGAVIYSLGNPLDLGMTVTQGNYNGLTDHSFYQRIHFSGAVNPGMSGGPVVDFNGDVVGVNVATSGNQVGFLVPADKLATLLNKSEVDESEDFIIRSEQQLLENQTVLMDELFAQDWPVESLGETKVIGEISSIVSCWGNSSRNKRNTSPVVKISKGCRLQDSIFVSRSMTTGSLEYEFFWYETEDLARRKFYHFMENSMGGFPGNKAGKSDATRFYCEEGFTQLTDDDDKDTVTKSFICARRYKQFKKLYDVFYIRFAERGGKGMVSHYTLAGVTQDSANRFAEQFLEHVRWQ